MLATPFEDRTPEATDIVRVWRFPVDVGGLPRLHVQTDPPASQLVQECQDLSGLIHRFAGDDCQRRERDVVLPQFLNPGDDTVMHRLAATVDAMRVDRLRTIDAYPHTHLIGHEEVAPCIADQGGPGLDLVLDASGPA